jgi:hypothetical protein
MISFVDQSVLWLLVPLVLGIWSLSRIQNAALTWLEANVSSRFRQRFSVYTRSSLRRHMVMLAFMGALLIVAGAGPSRPGKAEATAIDGRVLLLVDASASMFADDIETIFPEQEEPKNRLAIARQLALDLVSNLPGYRFALASYSGSGVVHLPMTTNQPLLENALEVLESHNYYKNTGSSLSSALDVVSHFVDPDAGRLQVVMLGDGELPYDEEFDRSLAALPPQGIVVHAITIGSQEGQSRLIYDFRDVIAEKEDPAVLREYTTRRVDKHLKKIAERTGGFFSVAEPGITRLLVERIRTAAEAGHSVLHNDARHDLAPWLLGSVLALFLFDALIFGHRRRPAAAFEIDRLGQRPGRATNVARKTISTTTVLLAAMLANGCSDSPRKQAHYENESGIGHDAFRRYDSARPHYERSRGFGIEPEIPTHNLARSVALAGDVSEAHELFQAALTLEPTMAEAFFNDGVTLYTWGQAERDPKNCDLERTKELWTQAESRFASTAGLPRAETEIREKARANQRFLGESLAEIERLIADPPEHCLGESPQSGGQEPEGDSEGGEDEESEGGGSGNQGSSGSEGDEDDESEAQSGGQPGGAGDEEQDQGGGKPDDEQGDGEEGDREEGDQDENQGSGGQDDDPEGQSGGGQGGNQEGDPDEQNGGRSGGPGGPDSNQPGDGSSGGLTEEQIAGIRELIQQLGERGREGERYHRRTGPEQFSKEGWSDPDPDIWW